MPNQKLSKLDDKSGKYVFIGYDLSSKGYKLYNPNNGKIIISRDVKLNEKEAWDWGVQEEEHNTPPLYEKEEQKIEDLQEIATPLSSPPPSTCEVSITASSPESSSGKARRHRSLQEIYQLTENQNGLSPFCLYVEYKPKDFVKAIQDEKRKVVMNEEIKAIRKNDT